MIHSFPSLFSFLNSSIILHFLPPLIFNTSPIILILSWNAAFYFTEEIEVIKTVTPLYFHTTLMNILSSLVPLLPHATALCHWKLPSVECSSFVAFWTLISLTSGRTWKLRVLNENPGPRIKSRSLFPLCIGLQVGNWFISSAKVLISSHMIFTYSCSYS